MAGYNFTPNRGLGFASALAQGVQQGFSAYNQRMDANQKIAMQQAEMQSQNELRRLQMEKLRQETAPIKFELEKLQVIKSAMDGGYVPESSFKKHVESVISNINSPARLQFAANAIQGMERQKTNALSLAPQGQPSAGMPDLEAQFQDVQAQPQAQPQEAEQPQAFKLTPKEAEFYGKMISSGNQLQLGMGKAQNQADQTSLNFLGQHMNRLSKLEESAGDNETKIAIQNLKNEFGTMLQQMRGETSLNVAKVGALAKKDVAATNRHSAKDVAEIRAGAVRDAARSRGGRGGGASADPSLKLLDSQIIQVNKEISALDKNPTGMGGFELPKEKAARRANLQARYDQLLQQRQQVIGGGRMQAPAAAAPSAPAGVIQQGNPRRKFAKGPGASAQIAKLPNGSEFEVDGQVYVLQDGKAVPR